MISLLSIIPIRKEPSETSEMVSQLLFGEQADALEQKGDWTRIHCRNDEYEGWVDTKMLTEFDDEIIPETLVTSLMASVKCGRLVFPITCGLHLPKLDGDTFTLAGKEFQFIDAEVADGRLDIQEALAKIIQLEHAPYLWGGKTPLGIDCSGLSQLYYRLVGYEIPRDASLQVQLGDEVPLSEGKAGDLAFFDKNGKVTHVGVLIDHQTIIHSSGCVRVDDIDEKGILNKDTKSYTHSLLSVRRLIES